MNWIHPATFMRKGIHKRCAGLRSQSCGRNSRERLRRHDASLRKIPSGLNRLWATVLGGAVRCLAGFPWGEKDSGDCKWIEILDDSFREPRMTDGASAVVPWREQPERKEVSPNGSEAGTMQTIETSRILSGSLVRRSHYLGRRFWGGFRDYCWKRDERDETEGTKFL